MPCSNRDAPRQDGAGNENSFTLSCPAVKQGGSLFLLPTPMPAIDLPQALAPQSFFRSGLATATLAAGTALTAQDRTLFTVLQRLEIPLPEKTHAVPAIRLTARTDIPAGELGLLPRRDAPALAWVVLSDKGVAGEREDRSGPAIEQTIRASVPLRHSSGYLLPDDISKLRALVLDLAINQGYDFIITSGGTGLGPRDTTPEALLPLLEKRLHGFEQAMLRHSLGLTPHAAISRVIAGSIGHSLILALPGSLKSVQENLQPILKAMPHALEKLQGNRADCGTELP